PAHHPARDMQDTFFIDNSGHAHPDGEKHGHLLLRTHTSPVQIRTMEKFGAPLRLIVPGRVFRYEATDATHDSTFNQIDGLLIDKTIRFNSIRRIMQELLIRNLQKEEYVRYRSGYFPFDDPRNETDILGKKGQIGQPDKCLECISSG